MQNLQMSQLDELGDVYMVKLCVNFKQPKFLEHAG